MSVFPRGGKLGLLGTAIAMMAAGAASMAGVVRQNGSGIDIGQAILGSLSSAYRRAPARSGARGAAARQQRAAKRLRNVRKRLPLARR